ncbi:MAG: efflux RND transporter permease subunit [Bacteroidota bacterium]
MSIYGSAVKKPITTLMIFVAVIVFGLYSLVRLPIDLYPDIEFPAITIFTTYSGAGAADIEANISETLEEGLNTVSNLKEVTSVSRDNISVVTLEFEYGTDLDGAANDIRDALGLIEDALPEGAEDPMILKFSSSMIPILFFAVTADESYEGINKLLEQKIVNPLNRIEGIGSISLIGVPEREILIEIDPLRLEALNLSVEQIGGVLQAENINMPIGNLEMGKMNYPLRVEGEFANSGQIANIVVGNVPGGSIYLKDVATVRDSIRDMSIDEKINGQKGIRMMVMKQSGANTVKIARDVNRELSDLEKQLPPDVKIMKIFDSSEFISDSISNLTKTLMFAFIFVVLVVLFFLGRWRATFIVVITIPISLIVSFIYLRISGNTINIISLSALSIAIGMVVDDAIVVLENITKHIERGSTPREAAIYATNEVWLAVIVTTLTVVAVFFPMTMISGLTGVMFRPLGWIVSITVTTSTIAAISLTPMLSSKLLRLKKRKTEPGKFSYQRTVLPLLDRLDNFYERTIRWSLTYKKTVLFSSIGIFIGSLLLTSQISGEFIPVTDDGHLSANVELQSGIRVDETSRIARLIESYISEEIPEAELVSTSSGSDDNAGMIAIFQSTGSNIINLELQAGKASERERSIFEIADDLRQFMATVPEIVNYSVTVGGGGLTGSGNNVAVEIYGYDIDVTTALANELADKISTIEGARDVQISREKEKPELRIILDKEKLSKSGLNTATVSMALRNRVDGMLASLYREKGEEYNIVLQYGEEFRNSITDIEQIPIQTPMGQTIRLGEIGEVVEYWSPPNIEHKRRERIVTVSATPYKVSLGQLATEIKAEVETMDIPQEILVDVGGAYEDQQESFVDLALLLLLSLMLVYIVMASQFESFKMPFIIMMAIPFAFTGVILALYFTGTNLSVIAALGAIMLVGIVVKNSIVLVDYINLMRDRGYELDEAIALSGKSRLRPVLMTAMTTILGMLPLALSTGEGSEIWSPMGISVIGGLIFSTVITLVIVPVIYRMMTHRGARRVKESFKSKFEFMDA